MFKRKFILLSVVYASAALGVPLLLVLAISQSYPVFNSSAASSGWQMRSQLLVLQPEGQLILPPATAFVVNKGPVTLLTYPRLDSASLQSQLLPEGKSFVTLSGRRYSLINHGSGTVELVLTQVVPPMSVNAPTPTPRPGQDRGFNLVPLDQRYAPVQPSNDELETFVLLQRENLLKRGRV